MKFVPTEKLFYKKYVCCLRFKISDSGKAGVKNNSTVKTIKSLLKSSKIDNRTRIDWNFTRNTGYCINFSVYLNDESMYQKLIDTYGADCYFSSKPINEEHRDRLLNKIRTVFRNRLLFNRFRYKVYLYTGWRREHIKEISDWISAQFQDKQNSRTGDYFFTGQWMITLYLKDESDLIMVQLCLADHIKNVTRIEVIKEAEQHTC